jgi:porphobilinogen synthase
VRETRIHPHDLVAPVFVTDSPSLVGPIDTLPDVRRYHVDEVGITVEEIVRSGIRAVILFGVPAAKDEVGSAAWRADGVIVRAIRAVRQAQPDLVVIADVCLCQYTTHGQCSVLVDGIPSNDETLPRLAEASVAYAAAGATLVAPSGMMDGAVSAIRHALDERGHGDVGILSYAVKHASAFYGPFRDAARSAPSTGNRESHQLDPANAREALREAASDVAEGADIIMVKPALTNLDTLVRLRNAHPAMPLAAYEVSGEYAMLRAAADRGWLNERAAALESLTAIKRAGADLIITYRAAQIARWVREA